MANQIVGLPLPIQVVDGQIADAAQLMGIGNYIAQQVNSNAAPITGGFTAIGVFGAGGGTLTTGTSYTIGAAAPFATSVITGDIFSEYSAGVFTPVNTGLYWVTAGVCVNCGSGTTVTQAASLVAFTNNLWSGAKGMAYFQSPLAGTFSLSQANLTQVVSLTAGATMAVKTFDLFAFTGTAIIGDQFFLNIIRVR